jgi:hypothetical protein
MDDRVQNRGQAMMKLDKDIFHDGKVHRLPPEKCGPSHISTACDGVSIIFDPPLKAGEVLRIEWGKDGITGASCEGHNVTIEKVLANKKRPRRLKRGQ